MPGLENRVVGRSLAGLMRARTGQPRLGTHLAAGRGGMPPRPAHPSGPMVGPQRGQAMAAQRFGAAPGAATRAGLAGLLERARNAPPPAPPAPGSFNMPAGGLPPGLFAPVGMGAANPAALPWKMPDRLPRATNRHVQTGTRGHGQTGAGEDVFTGGGTPQTAGAHINEHQDAAARNRQLFIEKYGMTPEQAQALEAQKAAAMSRGSHGPGAGGGMGMG